MKGVIDMGISTGSFCGKTYSVDVGDDGAIKVKPGDWLSKYSIAIDGDVSNVDGVYGRKNRKGVVKPIENVNLIYAGEIIYHIPTLEEFRRRRARWAVKPWEPETIIGSASESPHLSKGGVEEELDRFTSGDFQLAGEHLAFVDFVGNLLKWINRAGNVAKYLGLLQFIEGASKVADGVGDAKLILVPIKAFIAIINCQETLEKIWGLRAAAYATTAWAFDDPIPGPSKGLLEILRDPTTYGTSDRRATEASCRDAWAVSAEAAVAGLEEKVRTRYNQKPYYQGLLRALGGYNRVALADVLLKSLEVHLKAPQDLNALQATYDIKYPN